MITHTLPGSCRMDSICAGYSKVQNPNEHERYRFCKDGGFMRRSGVWPLNRVNQSSLARSGLSKRYRDAETNQHFECQTDQPMRGTARYASINTHLGMDQSRRDDLESLGQVGCRLIDSEILILFYAIPLNCNCTPTRKIIENKHWDLLRYDTWAICTSSMTKPSFFLGLRTNF